MPLPKGDPHRTRFRLRNTSSKTMTFFLEPWGEIHEVAQGVTIDIVETNAKTDDNLVEVEVGDKGITVHGWVRFFLDGRDLAGK